jgi:hypothetical protein
MTQINTSDVIWIKSSACECTRYTNALNVYAFFCRNASLFWRTKMKTKKISSCQNSSTIRFFCVYVCLKTFCFLQSQKKFGKLAASKLEYRKGYGMSVFASIYFDIRMSFNFNQRPTKYPMLSLDLLYLDKP